MNKKFNKKVLYAIAFWMLSILTFGSFGFLVDLHKKIKTLNADYFMMKTLNLNFTTADIFYNGPFVLGVIFFIFYMYFGTAGLKDRFVKEKSGISIKIISLALSVTLLFLVGIVSMAWLILFLGGE